jgi:hypothetical protein
LFIISQKRFGIVFANSLAGGGILKFRIGDRVRVNNRSLSEINWGCVGTVMGYKNNFVVVCCDDHMRLSRTGDFFETSLDLANTIQIRWQEVGF